MTDQETIIEMLRAMREQMATKDDLRHFATKDDLKTEIGAFRVEMKEELKAFATKDFVREQVSEVLTAVDGVAKQCETLEIELLANRAKTQRIEERLEVVELKVGIGA